MSQVKIQGNASGTGIFTVAAPNSNTDRTLTLPDTTGTVVVSGTTPSLNGIQFPATQSASADANTLDDYEEGTFTPTVTFGGNSVGLTYSWQQGKYVKIGNCVYVTVGLAFNKGSSTGEMVIRSFPFTPVNNNSYSEASCTVGYYGGFSGFSGSIAPFALFDRGNPYLYLRKYTGTAGSLGSITNTDCSTSTEIICSGFYFV